MGTHRLLPASNLSSRSLAPEGSLLRARTVGHASPCILYPASGLSRRAAALPPAFHSPHRMPGGTVPLWTWISPPIEPSLTKGRWLPSSGLVPTPSPRLFHARTAGHASPCILYPASGLSRRAAALPPAFHPPHPRPGRMRLLGIQIASVEPSLRERCSLLDRGLIPWPPRCLIRGLVGRTRHRLAVHGKRWTGRMDRSVALETRVGIILASAPVHTTSISVVGLGEVSTTVTAAWPIGFPFEVLTSHRTLAIVLEPAVGSLIALALRNSRWITGAALSIDRAHAPGSIISLARI